MLISFIFHARLILSDLKKNSCKLVKIFASSVPLVQTICKTVNLSMLKMDYLK